MLTLFTDLRDGVGLGPFGAVMAEDGGGGGEVLAIDVAEHVVVHVRLPRHAAASLRLSWPGPLRVARSWTRRWLLSVLCSTYASAAALPGGGKLGDAAPSTVHMLPSSPPLNVSIVVP